MLLPDSDQLVCLAWGLRSLEDETQIQGTIRQATRASPDGVTRADEEEIPIASYGIRFVSCSITSVAMDPWTTIIIEL